MPRVAVLFPEKLSQKTGSICKAGKILVWEIIEHCNRNVFSVT
jgi:hypothetical protein